jgi:hypothetical protein
MFIVYYMLWPLDHHQSGLHIHCWLRCSPLNLASVYSEYSLCCRFDRLGCNVAVCVLLKC